MKTKFNRILYLLPILLVVVVSGCTDGGGGTNQGIAINVVPLSSNVFEGSQFAISTTLENKGYQTPERVSVKIKGLDSFAGTKEQTIPPGSLFAATPNTPGGTETLNFQLTAPQDIAPTGKVLDQNFEVWLEYNYKTEYSASLIGVNDVLLTEILQNKKSLPSPTTSGGDGPVSISSKIQDYVVVPTTKSKDFNIVFLVENVGGGVITDSSRSQNLLNNYKILIEEFKVLGKGASCDSGEKYVPVGGAATLKCRVTLSGSDDLTQLVVKTTIKYPYQNKVPQTIRIADLAAAS